MFSFNTLGELINSPPASPPASTFTFPNVETNAPVTLKTPVGSAQNSPLASPPGSWGSMNSDVQDIPVGSWSDQEEDDWAGSPTVTSGLGALTLEDRLRNPQFRQQYETTQLLTQARNELVRLRSLHELKVNNTLALIDQIKANYIGDEVGILRFLQILRNSEIPELEQDYIEYQNIMQRVRSKLDDASVRALEAEGNYDHLFKAEFQNIYQRFYDKMSNAQGVNSPRVVQAVNDIYTLLSKYGIAYTEIVAETQQIDESLIYTTVDDMRQNGFSREQIVGTIIETFNLDPTMAAYIVDLS